MDFRMLKKKLNKSTANTIMKGLIPLLNIMKQEHPEDAESLDALIEKIRNSNNPAEYHNDLNNFLNKYNKEAK